MTCTRPNIAFAIGKLSRYTSNPSQAHWQAVCRILKYLKHTMDYGIYCTGYPLVLEGFSDASWITDRDDHTSTSGWIFNLGGGAISQGSKKQTCIADSTMAAEFVALASCCKEAECYRDILDKSTYVSVGGGAASYEQYIVSWQACNIQEYSGLLSSMHNASKQTSASFSTTSNESDSTTPLVTPMLDATCKPHSVATASAIATLPKNLEVLKDSGASRTCGDLIGIILSDTMEIQIKKSTTIHPAHETPKHCLQSSVLDLLPRAAHIPFLYFFRQRQPNDSNNFFGAGLLKEGLGKVLVPFYLVAGRLGRDQNGRIEIKCNGQGVLFVEAETSYVLDDLGDFESSFELQKLVPSVEYTKDISSYPLLITQVTHFMCGGVCLTVAMHHTLADATSMIYFINAWAEVTRGVPISNPPFIDRTLLGIGLPTSPKFHHIEYDPPPSMNVPTQKIELQANPKSISSAIFNISVDQINTLKAKSKQDNGTPIKFTRFEILAAHIWRCLCKARRLSNDQVSKLYIPINGRSRLDPPLPSGYFGNVTFTGTTIGLSGDIISEPLSSTTERIREATMRMDDEYLKSALAYLSQQPDLTVLKRGAHTFKCPNLNISNVFHMPVSDVNFGWGRPMFARTLTPIDGTIHIFPSPNNDGSLYAVVNLQTQHMQLFKKLFYEIFSQCWSARSKY
ncbi:Shikimate O-hydroxycinnamoyltransferase [Citrus sinensis]|nr:Shikimate O-hydroxycinnamoyltransferase [Citrus sinensis]